MLGSASRTRLRGLEERLRLLRSRVPERAEAFHAATRRLESRIERLERRWWKPWPAPAELELLETPARELEQVVAPLGEIIDRAGTLADQVDALEPQASRLGHPRLEEWLRQRLVEWRADLDASGRRSSRVQELDGDRERLETRAEELKHAAQLCYQLVKAAELLRTPEGDEDGLFLARQLDALRETLADELHRAAATAEQTERLRASIDPLERRNAIRTENRGRMEGLGERLQQLRGWSRRLDDLERPAIARLEERRQELAFASANDRSSVDHWLAEADELLEKLLAAAREQRRSHLEQLESSMLELAEACGRQPEAEAQVAELRTMPVTRNHEHGEWLQKLARYRTAFQSTAKNYERELEQRLAEHVERLQAALRKLDASALAGEDREERDLLDHELTVMRRRSGVIEALQGLRQIKELERRVEALGLRVARQKQRLAELKSQRRRYRRALARIDPADLTPNERIDVEQIRHALGRRTPREPGATTVVQLEELMKKCELLLERLRRDETLATRRREELLAQLHRFDEELLRRYSPELAQRVEALLHGAPGTSRRWRSALDQLDRVEQLLDRLEASGRRLAAAELDRAITVLRARPHGRREERLPALVAELEGWDPHELPPASLRMKVRHEAELAEGAL